MRRAAYVVGALLLCVLGALESVAQPPSSVPRLGIFAFVNPRTAPFYVAFEERLRELGWVDGRTITIDFRGPVGTERAVATATEMVRTNPKVILAGGPEAPIKVLRQATTTIPIVMTALNFDPVARGYVASLGRPGGNITGVYFRGLETGAKQLELLREAVPKAQKFAVLWEPFAADQIPAIVAAARTLKIDLHQVEVRPPYDLDEAFARVVAGRPGGLLVAGSPIFFRERARIAQLALKHRLPTMAGETAAEAGAMLGYGANLNALYRRAAEYVDRILRGAAPADLPVEQAATFEVSINLKTVRALGLTLPPAVLQRATRVIE